MFAALQSLGNRKHESPMSELKKRPMSALQIIMEITTFRLGGAEPKADLALTVGG